MELAIRTEHLTKIYGHRLIAVNDLKLEVPKGSIFGLLGPNGAGKTTTFRLLLGLQRPSAGRSEVFGEPCGPNATQARAHIGHLPTNPNFPGNLRAIEYLDLLGKLCRLPSQIRKPRISSLIRSVGLLGATDQRIRTYSTGMRTRLGIAASLVGDPPLLLWDEPTAGLDPSARRFTLDLIRQLGESKTIVVATHILGDIDQLCDQLGVMHEGRMIFTGSMQAMKEQLRRDDFQLELDGADANIQHLAQETARLQGMHARIDSNHVMHVKVEQNVSRARALGEIMKLIEICQVSLREINSSQNVTENAYLQLIQEDEAHGFQR